MSAWWEGAIPAEGRGDERLRRLRQAMTAAFAEDRARFANAFEPSASWDGARWRWLRFSYGLPRWPEAVAEEGSRVLSWASTFLPDADATVGPLLALARRPEVDQPVFGFAYDGPGAWRLKLYLLVRPEAGVTAWSLAAQALGAPRPAEDGRGLGPLSMIGVDWGPAGLLGGRLYERAPEGWRLNRRELGPLSGRPLPGALLVRRVTASWRAGAWREAPRDAHIPLEPGELPQTSVQHTPLFARALAAAPARPPWAPPHAAVRWLAVPLRGRAPLTVYYVLRAP